MPYRSSLEILLTSTRVNPFSRGYYELTQIPFLSKWSEWDIVVVGRLGWVYRSVAQHLGTVYYFWTGKIYVKTHIMYKCCINPFVPKSVSVHSFLEAYPIIVYIFKNSCLQLKNTSIRWNPVARLQPMDIYSKPYCMVLLSWFWYLLSVCVVW